MKRLAPWTRAFPKQHWQRKPRVRWTRKVSKRREEDNVVYRKRVRAFLRRKPVCEACRLRKSTDPHHTRGRAGPLLLDERFWKAVCRPCHDWIREHVVEARALGLLCDVGEWNTMPR